MPTTSFAGGKGYSKFNVIYFKLLNILHEFLITLHISPIVSTFILVEKQYYTHEQVY